MSADDRPGNIPAKRVALSPGRPFPPFGRPDYPTSRDGRPWPSLWPPSSALTAIVAKVEAGAVC